MNIYNPSAFRQRRAFLSRAKTLSLASLAACTSACVSSNAEPGTESGTCYRINRLIRSPNQDSRVRTLVLHYTAQSLAVSLQTLTDPERSVSAHYLVPDIADADGQFSVYELVHESMRAWHAGISAWQGVQMLNAGSIGIEITNLGYPPEDEPLPLMNRRWIPFADTQIAVVGQLAADIVLRHDILPHKVVGHADVAPDRKVDPGPLFPWQRLYEQFRVGAWPDAEAIRFYSSNQPYNGDIAWLQWKLLTYGYNTPQTGWLDAETSTVIAAFQMHFRPARYDGIPDVETVAILDALLEKYYQQQRDQTQLIWSHAARFKDNAAPRILADPH